MAFFKKDQNRSRKPQCNSLLQLCFCLSVYWNNFSCIFLLIWNFVLESFWVNISSIILGGIQLLPSHLVGMWGELIKMWTHASKGEGEGDGLYWCKRLHNFLVQKTTRATTQHNTRQRDIIRDNTTKHEATLVQHDKTRVQQEYNTT